MPGDSEGCTLQPSATGWTGQAGECAFGELPCLVVCFGTELRTLPQAALLPGMLPAVLGPSLWEATSVQCNRQEPAGTARPIQPLRKEGAGEWLEHGKYSLLGGIITSQSRGGDVCCALVSP